ncbi:hypothetical protein HDE_01552 [Halotydeus destructor]|nr:hypothetical protein HDE_01552 [Halotydeus destructor]
MSVRETRRASRRLANQLIVRFDVMLPRISSFSQIDCHLMLVLAKSIFHFEVESDLDSRTSGRESEIKLFTLLLNHLTSIIGTDLKHIDATELCNRNPAQVFNLLEIFDTFATQLLSNSTSLTLPPETKPKWKSPSVEDQGSVHSAPSSSSANSIPSASRSSSITSLNCLCPDIRKTPDLDEIVNPVIHLPKRKNLTRQNTGQTTVLRTVKRVPTLTTGKSPVKELTARLREAKNENFALELGHKLHEALQLEEKAKSIEKQLDRYYNVQRVNRANPSGRQRSRSASAPRRGPVKRNSRPQSTCRPTRQSSTSTSVRKKEPEFHLERDPVTLHEIMNIMDVQSPVSRQVSSKLETLERQHRAFIDSLKNDIRTTQNKAALDLVNAVEKELKRAELLKRDLEHFERIKSEKERAMLDINHNVLVREMRLERASLHRRVENFCNEAKSKFAVASSKHDNLIRTELDRRMKEDKQDLLDVRNIVRLRTETDARKNKQLVDAIENLYRTQFDAARERMAGDEKVLKSRISQNSRLLFDIQREMKSNVRNMKF